MFRLIFDKNLKNKVLKVVLVGIICLLIIKACVLYVNLPIKSWNLTLLTSVMLGVFTLLVMLLGKPDDTDGDAKFYDNLWGISSAAGFAVAICVCFEFVGMILSYTELASNELTFPLVLIALDSTSFSFWVLLTINSKGIVESFER